MRRPGSEPEVLSRYESGYAAVLLYTHSLYPHSCNSAGFSFDFGFNFTLQPKLCVLWPVSLLPQEKLREGLGVILIFSWF